MTFYYSKFLRNASGSFDNTWLISERDTECRVGNQSKEAHASNDVKNEITIIYGNRKWS